ncbi:LysE family translocator [Gangjinia marincola]|uniref:LysE family translocator n=1 Tax=Gangjinia marincola TaxID=578463 RepID=A0ABN1MJ06_9FLAO
MVEILFSFCFATTVLALSPGPDNIYVLLQSITHGTKYGLATVYGLISGCIFHTTLIAFGVSALIKANDSIYIGLKIIGACYLLYLAYNVYTSSAQIELNEDAVPKKTTRQLFKQGVLMNILNPKVSLFFLAFFPGFLFSESLSKVLQFYVLGGLFMLVSLIIFSTIAVLSGSISSALREKKNLGVMLKWLQIVVFVGIAVFILVG